QRRRARVPKWRTTFRQSFAPPFPLQRSSHNGPGPQGFASPRPTPARPGRLRAVPDNTSEKRERLTPNGSPGRGPLRRHFGTLFRRDRQAYPGDARDNIARYLGFGRTTIERAEAVVEAAEEEPEEYGHLVEQMDRSGKVAGAFRRLTVLKQAKELEAKPPKLPTGPFQVIVADPPWEYASGNSLPYPTMSLDEIRALPVQDLSEQDAILWLWTTNTHLRAAFEIAEAWGFEYKTAL